MKKIIVLFLGLCILLTNKYTYANSGPTYWKGYPSYEILAIEENSPIEVVGEDLIFDFTEEDHQIYKDYSMFGRVTARYTMLNNTKDNQTVQMAFPFVSYFQDFNPKDIHIKVNNEDTPFKVYIGKEFNSTYKNEEISDQMDFSSIIEGISNSKYSPKNYDLDEVGHLYTYEIVSKDDENLNITIAYKYDNTKSRIISKGFNGFQMNEGIESLNSWISGDGKVEIFLLGQDINFDFNAYLDGAMTNKTDRYSLNISSQEMSTREYLTKEIEIFEEGVSYINYLADNQVFNLTAELLDKDIEKNIVNLNIGDIFSLDYIARVFLLIYEVDFQPSSSNDISVSYMSKGTMDKTKTKEPIYTFNYILNPASNWAAFTNLNIEVRASSNHPYIIDSSIDLSRADNGFYTGNYETLPERDLYFSLYHKDRVTEMDRIMGHIQSNYYLIFFISPFVLGGLIGFTIRKIYKRYRKSKYE